MYTIERAGKYAVVSLTGEVDLAVRAEVLDSYDHAIALVKVPHLIVDLSDVTFMDSTGLSTTAVALNKVRARGGTMSVVGASDRIRRLFHIVQLDALIPLLADDPRHIGIGGAPTQVAG